MANLDFDDDQSVVSEAAQTPEQPNAQDGSLLPEMSLEESRRYASFWKGEIEAVDQAQQKWVKRCEAINRRYRDERNRLDEEGQRRMNVLWSTIETLHPALYGKVPQAIAERKFLDRDPVGRVAAQMLQRALRNEIDVSEYDDSVSDAVLDYLLCGRGQCWVRYEPQFGTGVSLAPSSEDEMRDDRGDLDEDEDDEETNKLEETGMQVIGESSPVDYVHWRDFYMTPSRARRWSEVQSVGKRVCMSHSEMSERFGKKIADMVAMIETGHSMLSSGDMLSMIADDHRKSEIIEIWNKSDRRVYWVAEGYDYLLDCRKDPLDLPGFFPCPRPLIGTKTNDTIIPVPDYLEWQDQAIMVDELTQRISMLSKACKVAGVYAAAEFAVRRLLDEGVENQLIPVDDWAAFADKGGVKGVVSLLPVAEVIQVLDKLILVRTEVLRNLDMVTGISDIMRGTSDSRETMGAQRLKSNYSTIRLRKRQRQVARFARDIIRLMAEIVSAKFSEESLIEASGALFEEGVGIAPTQQGLLPDMPGSQPPSGPGMPGLSPPGGQLALPPPGPMGPGVPPPPGLPPPMMGPGMPPGPPEMPPGGPMPGQPPMLPPPVGGNVVPFPGSPGMQPAVPGAMGGGLPPPGPPQGPVMPPGLMPQFTPPALRGPVPQGMLANIGGVMGMPAPFPQMPPGQPNPGMDVLVRIAKAILLLRHDRKGFRIDIETDSTIQEEAEQDKAQTVEFLKAVTMFLQQAGQIVMTAPEAAPMLGKFLQFGVRKFRTGRDLESTIDEFVDQMEKKVKAAAAAPKPPTPEQIELQTEQVRAQAEKDKAESDKVTRLADQQMENQQSQMELAQAQQTREHDNQQRQMDFEFKSRSSQMDIEIKQRQAAIEMERMEREAEIREQEADAKREELEWQHEFAQAEHERKMAEIGAKPAKEGERKPKAKPVPRRPLAPPVHGARQADDGHYYVSDPSREGKYMRVINHEELPEKAPRRADAMSQQAQALAAAAEKISRAAEMLTAPKRVVRDQGGKVIGVESVPGT